MKTRIDDLENKIKRRAHDRMETKIRAFRKAIDSAAYELTGTVSDPYGIVLHERNREVVGHMVLPNNRNDWPSWLWREEENSVRAELFAIMDEMQRVLVATGPKEGDDMPATEEGEA